MHNDTNKKSGINPVAGAVAGAVIGAGAAVAATVVLRDKKTQAKVKKAIDTAKKHASGYIENIKSQARESLAEKTDEMETNLKKGAEKLKHASD